MHEMTVSQLISRYLDETKFILKSHYSVVSVLAVFSSELGDFKLIDLVGRHVYGYVQKRLSSGIKPTTINRELSVFSAFVSHAVRKWGMTLQNPVRYQWLKTGELRLRYLDKTEVRRLVDCASSLRPDLASFILLALNTGCRKTELLTLRWSDVEMQRRYILLRPENTKSNKRRVIPLNTTALDALVDLKRENYTEWVFSRPDGRRIKNYGWLFRKAVQMAGIEDFRIHDLRHTFASWLVSEGVDLIKVRDLLGHSSIKMTERYAHLMPDRLLSAVVVLDSLQSK